MEYLDYGLPVTQLMGPKPVTQLKGPKEDSLLSLRDQREIIKQGKKVKFLLS